MREIRAVFKAICDAGTIGGMNDMARVCAICGLSIADSEMVSFLNNNYVHTTCLQDSDMDEY